MVLPVWEKYFVAKPEADLGMPLEIPKGWGVATLDGSNACGVIFFAEQLNWSAKGDLNLMKNRDNITL